MLTHFSYGSLMIILTSIVHTLLTAFILHFVFKRVKSSSSRSITLTVVRINMVVLLTIAATIIESSIWAFTYVYVGALSQFEEALYFSIITYTTLGYGDIVLSDQWRLLGSVQAANGIIMFGW